MGTGNYEKQLIASGMGHRGSRYVSSTGDTIDDGTYVLIHVIEATQFAALDDTLRSTQSDNVLNDTMPVGVVLGGEFTKIRLKSGAIFAYE